MQRLCAAHAVLLQWLCSGCAALTQHGGVLHEQHEGVAQSGADGFGARKEEVEGRQLQVLHRELRVRVVLLLGGGRGGKTGVGEVAKGAEFLWGLQKGQQNCLRGCKSDQLLWGLQKVRGLQRRWLQNCFGGCKRGRTALGVAKVWGGFGGCKGDGCKVALGVAKTQNRFGVRKGVWLQNCCGGRKRCRTALGFAKAIGAGLLWGLQS